MKNRSLEELKQIAVDIHKGLIFTDRHLSRPDEAHLVFMVLSLLEKKQLNELADNPPGLLFEYLNEAGPRSINGMPCFLSLQMLSKDDTQKMLEIYSKLKKAEETTLLEIPE